MLTYPSHASASKPEGRYAEGAKPVGAVLTEAFVARAVERVRPVRR